MSFTKLFGFMLFIWLMYYGIHSAILNPESLSPTVFENMNTVYNILRKPLTLLGYVIQPEQIKGNESFFQFFIPLAWGILAIPLCYNPNAKLDKKLKKSLKKGIIYEFEKDVESENKYFLPKTRKEKILDKFGLLKLTTLEKALFYRFSVVLPEPYQLALKNQIFKMNRVQRFRVESDGTLHVTSFDSYKYLFFKNNNINLFPNNNNGKHEYVIISAVVLNDNQEGAAVELWVSNKKIVRMTFQSDKDLKEIDGPLFISDINISPAII